MRHDLSADTTESRVQIVKMLGLIYLVDNRWKPPHDVRCKYRGEEIEFIPTENKWTGPLLEKLRELNGDDKTLRICWCHECKLWEITTGVDYFDKDDNTGNMKDIDSMDEILNIAIT